MSIEILLEKEEFTPLRDSYLLQRLSTLLSSWFDLLRPDDCGIQRSSM